MFTAFITVYLILSNVSDSACALSEGRYLTESETLSLFGNSFEVTYYNGSDYVSTTASYNSVGTVSSSISEYVHSGLNGLVYTFSVFFPGGSAVNNPDYISIDISPYWSVYDTYQIHSVIAAGGWGQTIAVPPFHSPQWRWHIDGAVQTFEGEPVGGVLPNLEFLQQGWPRSAPFVEMSYTSQTAFSCSSIRATFWGSLSDATMFIFVGFPYVSQDSSAATGTIATTTATSQTETTANTGNDMNETNGLLGDILDVIAGWLSGVADVIRGLFVPSIEYITDWLARLRLLFINAFGASTFDEIFSDLLDDIEGVSSGSAVLHFPDLTFNNSVICYGQDVDMASFGSMCSVTFAGSSYSLLQCIKMGFNLLATALFVNTFRNKWRALIHGETYVEHIDEGVA